MIHIIDCYYILHIAQSSFSIMTPKINKTNINIEKDIFAFEKINNFRIRFLTVVFSTSTTTTSSSS